MAHYVWRWQRFGSILCWMLVGGFSSSALTLDERAGEPGAWGFHPEKGEIADTNPPAFSWRPVKGARGYRVEVSTDADFEAIAYRVDETPWSSHYPNAAFTPGQYCWRYAAVDAEGAVTGWSRVRHFSVPADVPPYPRPDIDELVRRIPARHPRLFMRPEGVEELRALTQGRLARDWKNLLADAERVLAHPPDTSEPPLYPPGMNERDGEWKKIWWGNRTRGITLTHAAATLAFVYLLSGEEKYGLGARDLLMAFCAWDPKGSTNIAYNDEAGMPLLYYPARAYTWAWPILTETERERIRAVMAIRGADAFDDLMKDQHLWTPFDSHDNREWHKLGELAVAFQGEIPDAKKWLDLATTIYFVCYPVWGGKEGGWHEGAGYWFSYLDRFMYWSLVSQTALGIDPFDKPFFHQAGDFALYTLPPGAPAGAWGDQGNLVTSKQMAPLMATLALGARDPHWWWYAQAHNVSMLGDYFDFICHARALDLEPKAPTGLPQSRAFHDVGVAVLNTNLLDARQNVQVHFKSSPFGRQSHGYNANNAFMLYLRGEPVFTQTGRREVHGSPHHREWMWDSKSDNSILVNGKGQEKHSSTARGRIAGFKTSPEFDYVAGEAAESYEGRLTRCTRRILFFKPNVILIHDLLDAVEPSTFQWLLHARGAFEIGENAAHWKGEADEVQVQFLAPSGMEITQTDQFSTPPAEWAHYELDEWHLTASRPAKTAHQEFLTLMTIDGAEAAWKGTESAGLGQQGVLQIGETVHELNLGDTQVIVDGAAMK